MEALSACCGTRVKAAAKAQSGARNFLDPNFRFQEDDSSEDKQPMARRASGAPSTSGRSRAADASIADDGFTTPAGSRSPRNSQRGSPRGASSGPPSGSSGGSRLLPKALGASLGYFQPSTSTSGVDHVSLIQGASRGIGLEFVRQLLERKDLKGRSGGRVVATCRNPQDASELQALQSVHGDRLTLLRLDVTDEGSIEAAAAAVRSGPGLGRLDLLVNCAGVLHVPGKLAPETSISALTESAMLLTFRVNALGPTLVARAFAPLLAATAAARGNAKGQPTLIVNLSARLSSIKENKLGGWYAYRASKSALNMLTKTLAVEFAREGAAVACLLLHPGTVATDLSRPFNRNVPAKMLFSTETSVRCMLDIVLRAGMADTGKLFTWDGSTIEW